MPSVRMKRQRDGPASMSTGSRPSPTCISGLLAALVGIILASRMTTSQPNSATGYEMNAIAAAVIGGTSLMGGVGTVGGTVIGSFIIGILTVGLTMQGANYFMQQIVIGLVVVGAVTVDQFRSRRK